MSLHMLPTVRYESMLPHGHSVIRSLTWSVELMLAPVFFLCKPCRLVSACFHTQISQIAPQASGDLVHHRPLVKEMTLYLASPIFRSTSSSIYIGWQSDLTSLMTAVACRYTSIRQVKVHLLFHTRLPRERRLILDMIMC